MAEYKRIKMLVPWKAVKFPWEEEKPTLILPLGVEPEKPRLLWDARFLNLFLKHCPFSLDGVDKVPTATWEGMHLFKLDHKSGYLHVPFHRDSWTFLGVEWEGEVLVFTALAFGGSNCPVIYHSLSEATGRYIRRLQIPLLVYIDDFAGGTLIYDMNKESSEQLVSARKACYVTTLILFCAGYFLGLKKCVMEPKTMITYLGIDCDTKRQMFWIPKAKREKLLALITKILNKGFSNFNELEKVVGKCRAMSIAVPAAVLYTRIQYQTLKKEERPHKRGESNKIVISKSLRKELEMWLNLKTFLNGAKWRKPGQVSLTLEGYSDSSSRRVAGIFTVKGQEDFIVSQELRQRDRERHINEQEGIALRESIEGVCINFPEIIKDGRVLCRVDSKVLYDVYYNEGTTSNEFLTDICKRLFWLQIEFSFELKLELVESKLNLADPFTREDVLNDLRLTNKFYFQVWNRFGPFQWDIMASSVNVKTDTLGKKLKFFSRYFSKGCDRVNVFQQNISTLDEVYCFPPFGLVSPILSLLKEQKASATLILPDIKASWWSVLKQGEKASMCVGKAGTQNAFISTKKNGIQIMETFAFDMLAVRICFTQ